MRFTVRSGSIRSASKTEILAIPLFSDDLGSTHLREVDAATGGALAALRGIGEATARLFASEGAAVGVIDLNEAAAKAVADSINKSGGKALAIRADVRNAQLSDLARELNVSEPLSGATSATIRVTGTPKVFDANVDFDILRASVRGETIDRLRGDLHYAPRTIELRNVEADIGAGCNRFDSSVLPPPPQPPRMASVRPTAASATLRSKRRCIDASTMVSPL